MNLKIIKHLDFCIFVNFNIKNHLLIIQVHMKHLILLKIPPHGKVPMGGFEKCCLLQQVLKSSVLSSDSLCSEYPCCFPTVQLLGWCLCPKSWVSMFLARLTSLDMDTSGFLLHIWSFLTQFDLWFCWSRLCRRQSLGQKDVFSSSSVITLQCEALRH